MFSGGSLVKASELVENAVSVLVATIVCWRPHAAEAEVGERDRESASVACGGLRHGTLADASRGPWLLSTVTLIFSPDRETEWQSLRRWTDVALSPRGVLQLRNCLAIFRIAVQCGSV